MNPDETLLSGTPAGGGAGGAGGGAGAAADIDEKVLAEAVRRGLITPSQGSAAREEARSRGVSLLGVLRTKGLVSEDAARDIDEETKEDFVPGYRVLSKLGEGGMGVVYRALQKRLDREVALKVVMPRLASDPAYLKRFEREAKAVGKLNHPAIVAAYDYGESNGRVFLAMEFVDGTNLADWIRKNGPMPADRALAVGRDVAAGLAHACAAGIIHRDIKPGNILLAKPRPGETGAVTSTGAKVTDLGLARMGNQAGMTELTAAGSILGTPGYMPPEQAFGEAVDHRADIYALGATLYQLMTGQRPFDAPTPVAVIARQQTQRLPDPRDCVPGVPPGAAALLQGMLSREAKTRYPGWKEVLADFDLVRDGKPPAFPLPPEEHRSLAEPTGAVPRAPAPPTLAAPGPLAPTLSTPALARSVSVPPTVADPPPVPPAPAPAKKPLVGAVVLFLLVGIALAFAMHAADSKRPSEAGSQPSSAPPASADSEPVKEVTAEQATAEAKADFAKLAEAWRRSGSRPAARRQRITEAMEKSRAAVEKRVDNLLRKGEYAEALDLVRTVRKELGDAPAPRVDELLHTLEGIGDRGPAERAAVKAVTDARTANDPVALLAASEGFEGKYDFSPDLGKVRELRTWAEAEAPVVTVESDPKGALLLVGGKEMGTTPCTFRRRIGEELPLELRLSGYETEKVSKWVERGKAPDFMISLRPERPADPVPAVLLVREPDSQPLWTGSSLGRWSPAGGEWGLSDPTRTARLEGEMKKEPSAMLRGKSAALTFARLDLERFVKEAPGWRLEWQMIGEARDTGNTVLVEMQFAVRESGTALVLGIDDQAAYLGSRDGASKALTRTHWLKDLPANRPHTFAVDFHGDVFVATVDGKPLGSVAAPADLAAARTIRAAVEGGAGFFSDILLTKMRRP